MTLTSGIIIKCREQMPHECCKTVSQSRVSQGKVGGKCLQQPVLNQGTQQQSAATWNARAGELEDSRNEEDGPSYTMSIVPDPGEYKLSKHQAS